MNAAMELEELAENQASVLKVYHRSSGVYSGWFRHCHSPSIGRDLGILPHRTFACIFFNLSK